MTWRVQDGSVQETNYVGICSVKWQFLGVKRFLKWSFLHFKDGGNENDSTLWKWHGCILLVKIAWWCEMSVFCLSVKAFSLFIEFFFIFWVFLFVPVFRNIFIKKLLFRFEPLIKKCFSYSMMFLIIFISFYFLQFVQQCSKCKKFDTY